MSGEFLVISLLIPLIVSFITPIFNSRIATILSAISYIPPFLAALYCLFTKFYFSYPIIDFGKPLGLFYIISDPWSNSFAIAITIVSSMVALYSLPYMSHRFHELHLDVEKSFKTYFPYFLKYHL